MNTERHTNFESDTHALYAGVVLGLAMKAGLRASPRVDDDGWYTPELEVELGGFTITLVVPEPPEGWSIDGWLA